ncbi:MAG: radical SAM protein [Bacteroidales bacterium]|nr:radical SAM protein [Bacteroidales bacterium]
MFTEQLSVCNVCPRFCGVNRLAGKTSDCGMDASIQVSHIGLHHGEEPPISGTGGSGAIFFAGCNLHCVYCQNHQISQQFRENHPKTYSLTELVDEMLKLQEQGAHNINFVSPSHVAFQMADAIVHARKSGLKIPVVYNSNGYDSVETLKKIRGLVDIYLPDIKYLDNALGWRYSKVKDYADVIPGVLKEMYAQVGDLAFDKDDNATRGMLVRHLVLPGMIENSKQCLKLLSEISPNIYISLMSQYSPLYKASQYPEINRSLTVEEYDEIMDYAMDLDLENVFIQELESKDACIPDFSQEKPFNFEES